MSSFIAILIIILIVALIISLFFGAIAFVIRFAVPILIIVLGFWLYNRFKKPTNNTNYSSDSYSTEDFSDRTTGGVKTRKEARNVSTSDVKNDEDD